MAATYSPKLVTSGLVMCLDAGNRKSYPGTGSKWYDLSGNGYHFDLLNSPTFNSSDSGGTLSFTNSASQTAKYTSFPFAFANGSFTIGITTYYIPATSNEGVLLCAAGGGIYNSGAVGLEARFRGTSQIEYSVNDGIGSGIRLQSVPSNPWGGRWSMIWVRHTAQASATLYDIGAPITTQSYSGEIASATTSDFYIGRGWDTYFNGKISTVHLYDRALSENEILQNVNTTKGRFGL